MSETTQGADPLDFDVAVIGAGVAGCYTAWRLRSLLKGELAANSPLLPLLEGKDRLNVGLFEVSDRIGGRLWSAAVNGMPGEFVEFGGMRFYKQMHIVWNLIEKLGLGPRAIPFPVSEPHNVVYLRGKHLREDEIAAHPELLPYHFRDLEIGKSAGALLDYVSDTAIEGFSDLRKAYAAAFDAGDWELVAKLRREYEARKRASKIGGRTVYEMSWWELQTAMLSNEAFDFILDGGGYDVTNTNGNAAHSMDQNFFSGPDWEFHRLSNGYEELPDTLHKQFHQLGGHTYLLHRLLRFDRVDAGSAGGPYELLFHQRYDGHDSSFEAAAADLLRRDVDIVRVRAKMIVLAMPVRALRLLDQDNFFFHPSRRERQAKLETAMDSVLRVPAFKLFLAYHRPWWEQTGVSKGQSVTDLPVRQCYYWATAPREPASATRDGVLMATYNNGIAVPYWQSLQSGKQFRPRDGDAARDRAFVHMNWAAERVRSGAAQHVDAGAAGHEVVATATEAMVESAHAQLMEMHGVKYAPGPYDAHFQDWTVDPFGAGWHQWKSSSREDEDIPYMQKPMEEEEIFVVGECWSDMQGWVQGALNTSEAMLQDRLGLTWPAWLLEGGTWLGPRLRPKGS